MAIEFVKSDIIFESKAEAIPYNYRISYKVSLICLIIGKTCGKKGCSSIKLQMINSSINTSFGRKNLLNLITNYKNGDTILMCFDPAITRAIDFALIDKLIFRQANELFRLTDKGKELIKYIYKDSELMYLEKQFILELSNRLTEDLIESMSYNWRIADA